MEITTVVGIVVAVIIMLFGLRMLFKKPADAAPSLDSALHVDTDSQQPVIPRHVRDQLQSTKELEKLEPTLVAASVEPVQASTNAQEKTDQPKADAAVVEQEKTAVLTPASSGSESPKETENSLDQVSTQDSDVIAKEASKVKETEHKDAVELSLNTHIEKAEISEFEDESSILDEHLHEQQRVDEESALSTAVDFIALNIYPERRVLSGEKTLKVLLKYGLRFGEMACFHRYSQDDSKLLFSVLQITDDGAAGFDLETLSTEQVKGLAFFLALPHSDVQNAFDTMDSISRLIAREIDGTVYDQNNQEFTPQLREQWRHQAIDYRSGHAAEV